MVCMVEHIRLWAVYCIHVRPAGQALYIGSFARWLIYLLSFPGRKTDSWEVTLPRDAAFQDISREKHYPAWQAGKSVYLPNSSIHLPRAVRQLLMSSLNFSRKNISPRLNYQLLNPFCPNFGFDMTPTVSVNFMSLVTSCLGLRGWNYKPPICILFSLHVLLA